MYLYLSFISVILCFVSWFYLRWLKIKRYWADRNVPHLPPVPLIGSFTFLQRENIGNWFRRMYKHFNSPYIGIWIFSRPGLIVNSPEIARNILIKDSDNFRNRFLSSGDTDPIGGLNLFTINDPAWSSLRRPLNSVFTGFKLRIFQDYTRTKSMELVQRIRNSRNAKINLKALYLDYTTDVIGTAAFGVKSNAMLTGSGPLKDVTNDFSKYSVFRSLSWCSIFFCPELVDIFRFKMFPKTSTAYFKKIFRAVSSQRETHNKEGKNLLDILIRIQKENASFSEDLIIAQAAILLLGGFDTSGNLITFATYQLAHNPELQDKLYQELLEAVERNGSADFDIMVLSELKYLKCVIKETLRIFTPMGWIDRIAEEDYQIDDKLTIEAGTPVYINCFGMHYDPKYFPEPHKFDPDRFLPENKDKLVPYSFLPFGEGPRVCIGKRFGFMTVQFGLAQVLLNYKIQPYPDSPKPSDVKISTRTVWYVPAEPLYVQFIPRS